MRRIIAGVLVLFAAPVLCEDTTEIPQALVTATRTAQTADQSLSSVTVITRADIDREQPQSVMDLLTGLAGVAMANTGGLGKTTTLFLRGTNSDQLLVLIDGIKVGSVSTGTAAFEQIPVDQIDRIEIVRGPNSSLYGSDAVGGVIQIFTRQGQPGQSLTPSFSIGTGTYSTWQGEAGLTGGLHNAWYSASVSGERTNGINSCRGTTTAGCFIAEPQPDRDGYWTTAGSVRAGYRFDNGASVSVDWLRAYGVTQYDGDFGDESHVVQQVLGTQVRLPVYGPWQATITAGQSEDRSLTDQDGITPEGFFNTQRNSLSLQNDFTLAPRQVITVGTDYLDDHISSDTRFPETSRENIGVFSEYQGGWGGFDTQLSARGDHNQQFGDHYTGGAAVGYTFRPWLRATGSFATAFHAPTFDDLYFPDFGNPSLRPEKSRSAEIGVGGQFPHAFWALNAFQTLIDNLIGLDASFVPSNIDRARIRGLEGKFGGNYQGWRAAMNLTLLSPRDEAVGPTHGNLLPRRPQKDVRLDVDKQWRMLSGGTTIFAASRRYDDSENQNPLGGYTTVDFRGSWQFHPWWELQLKVANAFNKHYETSEYFNQLGRTVFVTLRYNDVAHPH